MRIRGPLILLSASLAVVLTLWPASTYAQRRPIHRARGTHAVVVVGGYYAPYYYYDPFYSPYWWYPSSFYGGPLPPGYWGYGNNRSSVRLQVTPRQAEVFVDGYVAGTVDDFDGAFQRLVLPPGDHEIVLYLAGYRTVTQKVYLTPGGTFRIRHAMEPLAPGESPEPRPVPPPQPPAPPQGQMPQPPEGPRTMPPPAAPEEVGQGYGSLSIRVQPSDAQVFIDDEPWETSGTGDRLVVQVSEGTHRVEVRKDGYETFTRTLRVRAGEVATVNVSLSRRDE